MWEKILLKLQNQQYMLVTENINTGGELTYVGPSCDFIMLLVPTAKLVMELRRISRPFASDPSLLRQMQFL